MPAKLLGNTPLIFSTGVRFDINDRQKLDRLAVDKNISRNALIREAVRQFLSRELSAQNSKKPLRQN